MLAEIAPSLRRQGRVGAGCLDFSVQTTAAVFLVNKKHAMTSISR